MELQPLHFFQESSLFVWCNDFISLLLYFWFIFSFHLVLLPLEVVRFTGLFCTTQLGVRSSGCIGSTGSTMSAWLRTVFFLLIGNFVFGGKILFDVVPPNSTQLFCQAQHIVFKICNTQMFCHTEQFRHCRQFVSCRFARPQRNPWIRLSLCRSEPIHESKTVIGKKTLAIF